MKIVELARSVPIVALVLCSFFFVSSAACDDVDGLIDEVLALSGLAKQLGMLTSAMVSAVPDDVFPSRKAKKEVIRFVAKAADRHALTAKIRDSIKLDLNTDALRKVLLFYRSRLGRKVGRIQGKALAPSFIRNVKEGRNIAASLSETRTSILKRIISAQRVNQASFQLLDQMANGLADGFLLQGQRESERIRDQLKSLVDRVRAADDHMERLILAAYARTLQRLSDKELEALAKFYESEAAQWFSERVQIGSEEAVYTSARALGQAISGSGAPVGNKHLRPEKHSEKKVN